MARARRNGRTLALRRSHAVELVNDGPSDRARIGRARLSPRARAGRGVAPPLWNLLLARSRDCSQRRLPRFAFRSLFAPVAALGWRVERDRCRGSRPRRARSRVLLRTSAAYTRRISRSSIVAARGRRCSFSPARPWPDHALDRGGDWSCRRRRGDRRRQGYRARASDRPWHSPGHRCVIAGYTLVDREGVQHAAVVAVSRAHHLLRHRCRGGGRLAPPCTAGSASVVSRSRSSGRTVVLLALRLRRGARRSRTRDERRDRRAPRWRRPARTSHATPLAAPCCGRGVALLSLS